jgi:hypothetical protein
VLLVSGLGAPFRQKDALPATIRMGSVLRGTELIQDMAQRVSKVVGAKLNRGNCSDKRRDGIACQDFLPARRYTKNNRALVLVGGFALQ